MGSLGTGREAFKKLARGFKAIVGEKELPPIQGQEPEHFAATDTQGNLHRHHRPQCCARRKAVDRCQGRVREDLRRGCTAS
jgi:hypothetical protein